jgi:hypothetical protein
MLKNNLSKLMLHKWEFILPGAAFLLAFALRYFFLSKYHYPMMIHEQDGVGYMEVAKSFMHLHLSGVTGRPPGYPIVIALFSLLPVELEYAARIASIFMDSLIVLPLFYIARAYLPRAGAFAVCLLWAFFSYSLYFAPSPLSQSSYLCYLLFGVALLHLGQEKRHYACFLASGMFMAMSYLARTEGIVGFGCGLFFCLTLLFDKTNSNRKNILIPVCFLFGFLILAGPYLVAMRISLGGWTLSALTAVQVKSADAVLKLNAKGDLQAAASTGLSAWKAYYTTLPIFLESIQSNIKGFVTVYLRTFPVWMNLLTGAGLLFLARKATWRDSFLLLILLLVTAPALVVNIPKSHSYLYPVFTMTLICFVSCLEALVRGGGWITERFFPVLKPRLVAATLSVIMLLPIAFMAFAFFKTADASYRAPGLVHEAAETEKVYQGAAGIIKNNSRESDLIMTRWGLVGYFAARPVLGLPNGGVKEVVEYGRKNGARFLLIDTKSVTSRRQELTELLGPLEGKTVNPEYGIEVLSSNYFTDIDSGYVIYRYKSPVKP